MGSRVAASRAKRAPLAGATACHLTRVTWRAMAMAVGGTRGAVAFEANLIPSVVLGPGAVRAGAARVEASAAGVKAVGLKVVVERWRRGRW